MTGKPRDTDDAWTLQTFLSDLAGFGDRPALLSVRGETAESWSFADVADNARRLAGGLIAAGVAPGEPVLLFAPNGPEWVVARLALGAAGALAVPLDDLSSAEEVEAVLNDSGCRRAFAARAHVAMLRQVRAAGALDIIVLDGDEEVAGARSWRALLGAAGGAPPSLDPQAPAMLVYTSGTTGAPKSFALSSANIHANVRPLVAERLIGPGDRMLLPLPLHHVYPFVVGLLVPLASGAAVVFPEAVAGPQIVQALRVSRATGIVGVPRLYEALVAGLESRMAGLGRIATAVFRGLLGLSIRLRRRFGWRAGRVLFRPLLARIGPKVRLLVCGGARLEESLIWRLEGLGWEVRGGYGLAETASIFTGNLPGRERIGSEGRPFQGGEIRIAEPDEAGVGEIQLRGPNVFTGYRDDAGANRDAFTPDGWFRTGDLGRLDREGFLYFAGRVKELIVLGGGKNVLPEAVEKVYGASPFIREVAVLEHAGALHALVLPDLDAIAASGAVRVEDTVRVALAAAARHLPGHQRLAGYALVREPVPRTRLGKFRRFLLPDVYERARRGVTTPVAAEMSAHDRAFLERPLPREVWRLLNARYADKPLSLEASPQLDLGIDSLEWLTLSLELERRLGIRLTDADVAGVMTVRDLIQAVQDAAVRPPTVVPEPVEGRAEWDPVRWTAPTGSGHLVFAVVLFWVNRLVTYVLFRLQAEGRANLPAPGPFIVVANHASDLDPLVMAAALPLGHMRRIYWGGDVARLFAGPVRRFLCRVLHVFPIDEHAPAAALEMAARVLRRGDGLIWFPEAWRSPTGEVQTFLPGIGRLIEETRATAVPAHIAGTFEAMPRWVRWPRPHPVRVRFGARLSAETLASSGEGETDAARITAALRRAVTALGQRE